ncbi:hypothetical protein JTE90_010724 [Oedothorax gibbosus]|uniref:6-phosphogluconate dehydrogenase NADP-binding domain-containing protein n=1 Tax=Oedothorax gibbosus TaxID=931172 RepID=A0AAV6URM2_9ARAC|nr:hypothetical protein JTE90_010724 [Oedothorax gibbosus]
MDSPATSTYSTPDSSPPSSSDVSPSPVGFIGLSRIGRIILRKLLDANIPIVVFDKYLESVRSTKVTKCTCPADVILKCKITFCCELEESCLEIMVFGYPKGVLHGLDELQNESQSRNYKDPSETRKGLVMLETINPDLSVRINTEVRSRNGLYVEAPMIGTIEMAENNSLNIVAAGDQSIFRECEQYFRFFAKKTLFKGEEIGRALHLKVVHSMMDAPTCSTSSTPDFSPHSPSDASPSPVGFIGLSSIGRIIAKKLLDANIPIVVFDKYLQSVTSTKVTKCTCPAEVIFKCKITFCCEPEERYLEIMVFGYPKGVLHGLDALQMESELRDVRDSSEMDKGFVLLETINPDLSVRINSAIRSKNGLYVEAPVIGTIEMAKNNSLKIIATGNHSIFRECEQYFRFFAKKTLFKGEEIGRALHLKGLHSMIEGTMNGAQKEILTLAQKGNLSTDHFLKMLDFSKISCPTLMEKAHAFFQKKKENTFDIKALRRDILTLGIDLRNAPIAGYFTEILYFSQIENEQADALESA